MKEKFEKLFLYISSFIPLYFLIIVKELTEIINGNLSFDITNSIMLSFNALLIILGSIGVILNYNAKNYVRIEIVEIKNITCQNFLPFFPLFVLFALAFELEFISMAIVYLLILIMIGIVYLKNDMLYVNPFLNIVGLSTYEVKFKDKKDESIKTKKVFAFKNYNAKTFEANNLFLRTK